MSGFGVGLSMFAGMLVLMALRVPIAISMFIAFCCFTYTDEIASSRRCSPRKYL